MREEDIVNELIVFVTNKIGGSRVTKDTNLSTDVPFDSLDRMELVTMIQEKYGVLIDAEEYIDSNLDIISKLSHYVATRIV